MGEPKNQPPFTRPVKGGPKQIEPPIRDQFVEWLMWGVYNHDRFIYSERRPIPVKLKPAAKGPIVTDCSGFITLMAKWAGAPDPNGLKYNGEGYTGTLLDYGLLMLEAKALPGDLIIYGPGPGQHVVGITKILDGDFEVASHGKQGDPRLTTNSAEAAIHSAPVRFRRWLPA